MKSFFCCLLFALASTSLYAQTCEVPKNYKLVEKEDYAKYNKDVLNCIDWMENMPIDRQPSKRREATTFLMTWMTGTPDVTISIDASNLSYCKRNPELIIYYMNGWTKYALEHPGDTSMAKGNFAGIRSVLKVYKANESFKKDKTLNKMAALNDAELEKWIADNKED